MPPIILPARTGLAGGPWPKPDPNGPYGWVYFDIDQTRQDLSPASPYTIAHQDNVIKSSLALNVRLRNTGAQAGQWDYSICAGQINSGRFSPYSIIHPESISVAAATEKQVQNNVSMIRNGDYDLLLLLGQAAGPVDWSRVDLAVAIPKVLRVVDYQAPPSQPVSPAGNVFSTTFNNTNPSRDATVTASVTIQNPTSRQWLYEIDGGVWANLGAGYAKQGSLWDRPLGGTSTSPIVGSARNYAQVFVNANNSFTVNLYSGPWGIPGYYPVDIKLNLYAYNDQGSKVLVNTKALTNVITGNF